MSIALQYNDHDLVERLKTSDQAAFTQLYEKFYDRVYFFARRYVEETEAQDITADTFLQVWRKREDFERIESLAHFMFITSRNACFNLLQRARHRHKYATEMEALMSTDHSDNLYFEQQVRIEMIRQLNEQVNLLPEKMREVFLLSFEEGLKPAQIAEKLGISVKTVKNQKLSAINVLRATLKDQPHGFLLLGWLLTENSFHTV